MIKNIFTLTGFLLLSIFVTAGCGRKATSKVVSATSTDVSASKIVKDIAKGKDIFIQDATIIDDLNFFSAGISVKEGNDNARIYIQSGITFVNCIFNGKVLGFQKDDKNKNTAVRFEKNLTFLNCKFNEDVDLKESDIDGMTNFTGSTFMKNACFEGVQFGYKSIYFSDVVFNGDARFQRSVFEGNVNFMKVNFQGNCSFQNAVLKGNAQFGACKFFQYTEFDGLCAFQSVLFNYAEFIKNTVFNQAVFHGRTEFIQCKFIGNCDFQNVHFNGNTKFNNSNVKGKLNLENAVFLIGKPGSEGLTKEKEGEITFKNTILMDHKTLDNF